LLDALGTLLALAPPGPALREELARRFGIEVSVDEASAAIAAEIAYYRGHLDEGRDAGSLAALRRRCAEVVREALPATAELDADLLTDSLLASLRFSAFPDAAPALGSLRAQGVRLVVVSNWDISLHDVLARVKLAPLLDGVVTSAEAGERKPAPGIFKRALALAGVAPDEAVHIGDSVHEDVEGARAAGIEPILIRRDGGNDAPGTRTITGMGEL
jgi:putative hydrolase of the HAD superfamily